MNKGNNMTFEVYITPKNESAAKRLKRNFPKIDTEFRKIHDQDFMYDDKKCEHGLILYDRETIFGHVYAHWDDVHLKATKQDAKKAIKKILGSTKDYKVTESF